MKKLFYWVMLALINYPSLLVTGQSNSPSVSIANSCYSMNGLYVDGLSSALGNSAEEQRILDFVRNNGYNYLLIYELNSILPSPTKTSQLASFIRRARSNYFVAQIGGVTETASFGQTIISYNNSHPVEERFDVVNLEFEFWSSNLSGLGYCDYLTSYGACNRTNAFRFYIDQINALELATQGKNIETEVYIGWPTDAEASSIASAVDRVLVHHYRKNEIDIFGYGIDRINALANGTKPVKIAPIFSSEGPDNTADVPFMGDWLKTNPIDRAFESWISGYNNLPAGTRAKVPVMGASWFTYGRFKNTTTSHINLQPQNQIACPGETKSFSVSSSASNKKYYWEKNGKCLSNAGNVAGVFTSTLTISNINVSDTGIYTCRIISLDTQNPSSWRTQNVRLNLSSTCGNTRSPFNGTAVSIPGIIEAENYDIGGQGLVYNDKTISNEGGAYRTDAVDVEPASAGGYNVGYVQQDEWMEYTINVTQSGAYNMLARIATIAAGKSFRVDLDGTSLATFTLPNTGGWQNWQSVTLTNILLSAGQKIVRVYATTGDFNLDKLELSKAAGNQNPTVVLTSPTNGSTYTAPASIVISANASDPDGLSTIRSVAFYNGTTLLFTDNTSPYSFTWSGVAVGTYSISANVTDNAGASVNSAVTTITVNTSVNQSPSVSITAPTNGSTYTAPASIVISANASDPDGLSTIRSVAFYNGTTLLFTDNTSPYSFTWSGVAAGTYSISANVTDNAGASANSAVTMVAVTPTNTTCSGIPNYIENGGYTAGSIVRNGSSKYQCKPWPYSGWCNGAAWAYAPGLGEYWNDAWLLLGSCGGRLSQDTERNAAIQISPNPVRDNLNINFESLKVATANVKIIDALGNVVLEVTDISSLTSLSVSSISSGVYYVHLDSDEISIHQKIIILK